MRTLPFSVRITASYEPSGSMVSGGGAVYARSSACSSSLDGVASALSSGEAVASAVSLPSAESVAASSESSPGVGDVVGVGVAGVGPVGPAWPPPKKTAPRLTTSTTMPTA